MSKSKVEIIRDLFLMEMELGFETFRDHPKDIPDRIAACPDREMREEMLLGFWHENAARRYPHYQRRAESLTLDELLTMRDALRKKVEGDRKEEIAGDACHEEKKQSQSKTRHKGRGM